MALNQEVNFSSPDCICLYKQLNSTPCHYDLLINYRAFNIPAKFQVNSSAQSRPVDRLPSAPTITAANEARGIKLESNCALTSFDNIKKEAISFSNTSDKPIYIDCDSEEKEMNTFSEQAVNLAQGELREIKQEFNSAISFSNPIEIEALFSFENCQIIPRDCAPLNAEISSITMQPSALAQQPIKEEEPLSVDAGRIRGEASETEDNSMEEDSCEGDQVMWWFDDLDLNFEPSNKHIRMI